MTNLWYGIVENNYDPEFLGRVQVRIVGKHTENRTDATAQDYLPVTDLPWAQTLQYGTVISNQGGFTIPKNGTVVIVSFMDEDEQLPIILGSVPKLVEALPDFTQGFTDPNGENPTEDSVGVSPISNYATGQPVPDGVTKKLNEVETGINCIDESWDEPETPFSPVYPYNQVIQNGEEVFELDATPGAERINLQHDTGTFKEIHPDGVQVTKIKGKEYLIVEGDRNVLIKGGSNITVQGISRHEASDIKMEGATVEFTGTTSITVDTDGTLTINAATGTISIDGVLTVSASLISLN